MNNNRLVIIMLGPPGAGKSTQARMMGEALKLPRISTGDILREALKNETELGEQAKAFMESGALVPDKLVDAIVAERLKREDCSRGFILDGYPRTIDQAEFLGSLFGNSGTKTLTLGIVVEDKILIQRLSSRWTCPQCGKMFKERLDSGKTGATCDECGARLIQRKDDTAGVIAERLQVYHKTSQLLIGYYRELGVYAEVDGDRAADEIFDDIMNKITNYQ